MSFIYAFTDTRWSAAGTTYNGIGLDLSNGAGGSAVGAAASRALKLTNNGAAIFDVSLTGAVSGASYSPTLSTVPANGMYLPAANTIGFSSASSLRLAMSSIGVAIGQIPQAGLGGISLQVHAATNQNLAMHGNTASTTGTTLDSYNDAGNANVDLELRANPLYLAAVGAYTVGIGLSTTPSAQLHTTGSVRFANFGAGAATFDASGNVSSVSDESFKENIKPLSYGIKELRDVNPIQHTWNKASDLDTDNIYTGFSAQNLEKAVPDIVFECTVKNWKEPNKTVTSKTFLDRGLLAIVVNAVKELDARMTAHDI